ncbi:MAG: VCBS repeat-containing protein [Gammaproteobacteria bacterium]|nr:VCBS repeat-containing protein [Gammaproteobacteria bacterium]
MNRLLKLLATAALVLLTSAVHAVTSPVGAMPGEFAVSKSGAATYSIPIQVPPGVGGMQPNISLNYNSQGGNGIAGVGWNIGGLSAITRCGASIVNDGIKRGVDLTANDKFCLDGQRLIDIGASTVCSGGREFRTDVESFNKVVSCGTQGNGPAYFKVWAKSGQLSEYGVSADALAYAQGNNTALYWAVNRIQDTVGNYIAFIYTADSYTTGEHRIDHIDYTYNGAGAIGGVVRKVAFVYATRTDVETAYVGGAQVRTSKRLTNVQTFLSTSSSALRDYRLTYEAAPSAATYRSRLASVQECGSDAVCLQPTTFVNSDGAEASFSAQTQTYPAGWNFGFDASWESISGDFNGDAKMDYARLGGTYAHIFISNGDGTFSNFTPNYPTGLDYGNPSTWRTITGDFIGDGTMDIGKLGSTAAHFFLSGFNARPGTFYPDLMSTTYPFYVDGWGIGAWETITGDFNGDGKTDFAQLGDTYALVSIGKHTITDLADSFTYSVPSYPTGWTFGTPSLWKTITGDFNGDGKTDYARVGDTSARIFISKGDGWFINLVQNYPLGWNFGFGVGWEPITGDFNGDGKTDYARLGANSAYIFISKGDGTFSESIANYPAGWNFGNPSSWKAIAGDFNGDGKTDYARLGGTYAHLFISRGDGTFSTPVQYYPAGWDFGNPSSWKILTGDFNGDGRDDYARLGGTDSRLFLTNSTTPDLITKITNGLGVQVSPSYKSLTDSTVYTKSTTLFYSGGLIKNTQRPRYVVSSVSNSNGIEGEISTTSYKYDSLRESTVGYGDLGFSTINITGSDGTVSSSSYSFRYPTIGMLTSSNTTVKGIVRALVTNTLSSAYSPNNRPIPYVSKSVTTTREVSTNAAANNTVIAVVTATSGAPDGYGNIATATVSTNDGSVKTTNTVYYNDVANWRLGLPVKTTVTNTVPAAFSDAGDHTVATGVAKTAATESVFSYNANGQLLTEVLLPLTNDASTASYTTNYTLGQNSLATLYTYDVYGNRETTTLRGLNMADRKVTTAFNPLLSYDDGRPVYSVTTSANVTVQKKNVVTGVYAPATITHVDTKRFDLRFGTTTSSTGHNNITTKWFYDGFGRKIQELRADNTATNIAISDCVTTYCNGIMGPPRVGLLFPRYWVTTSSTTAQGTPMDVPATVYYDNLGREMRAETQGFDGTLVQKDTEYDSLGRVARVSNSHFDMETPQWTTNTYDAIGRVYKITAPGNAITTIDFLGLTTKVTAPTGNGGTPQLVRTEVKNMMGQTVSVTDALAKTITYKYDPFGNLGKVINPVPGGSVTATNNTVKNDYDLRGRKTHMHDPDMGEWYYTYNTVGQVLTQTDPKGQVVTMYYDEMGRMYRRDETEQGNASLFTSIWEYDTAPNGKGKLNHVKGPTNSYERIHSYDSYGRLTSVGTSIDGELFTMNKGYDPATGRVLSTTYPTAGGATFATYNSYNTRGYLEKVTNGTNGTGTVYWQATTHDARGNTTEERLNNGLLTTKRVFDSIRGTLTDVNTGPTNGAYSVQNLHYDYTTGIANLWKRSDLIQSTTETFTYDVLNRLTDVAGPAPKTYRYDSIGNFTTKSDAGTYSYASSRPHAVTSVAGSVNGVANPGYIYDANGNVQSGAGRTIGYTSFNLPKTITTATETMSIAYDAEHQRIKHTKNGETVVYLNPRIDIGGHFAKETKATGLIEYKHYIYAGNNPVALYTKRSDSTASTRYLHKDHLGSTDVISKEDGTVDERLSYDAFGKRRNANGTDSVTQLTSKNTHHGYTGHEMIDSIGIIHMNGRTYDPSLGRFMQADPQIQSAANLQNYNRYSYVLNNPLNLTDPSGYNWLSDRWKEVMNAARPVVAVVAAVVVTAAGCPQCAGAVAGYILTGTLKGAAMGIVGALAYGVAGDVGPALGGASRVALHGAIGGVLSLAQGGSFASGFASGAFAKATGEMGLANLGRNSGILTRTAIAAFAGGAGSMLFGGSFSNGAVTGAFSHLFNDEGNHYFPRKIQESMARFRSMLVKDGVGVNVFRFDNWSTDYSPTTKRDEYGNYILGETDYKNQQTTFYLQSMQISERALDVHIAHEYRHLMPENFQLYSLKGYLVGSDPREPDAYSWAENYIGSRSP